MKRVDNVLRDWRIRRALPWIPDQGRVLDVGCFDARLFRKLGSRLGYGVGMDPAIEHPADYDRYQLLPGEFPDVQPAGDAFDVITFLAVLEHVPDDQIDRWADSCRALLVAGGLVVATVPSPRVDAILDVAIKLRIMDGMEAGQHHGFAPDEILRAFQRAGFTVLTTKQLPARPEQPVRVAQRSRRYELRTRRPVSVSAGSLSDTAEGRRPRACHRRKPVSIATAARSASGISAGAR